MSRTAKYILTTLLIIAAAMWILSVYRSCQNTKTTKDDTEISTTGDATTNSDSGNVDDLYEEEDEDAGGSGETALDAGGTDGEDSGAGSETTTDDEEEDEADTGSTTTTTTPDEIIGNGGEYLVIAGAFVAKSNAEKFRKQLKQKGYDSEIRIFLGSDYHSVIAGDYTTEAEAQSLARRIGGEAYVHKRRYPKKR